MKNAFNKTMSYIGEVGEFSFENKIITHKLDIYQIANNKFKKIKQ